MNYEDKVLNIGLFCRNFRVMVLHKKLREFETKTNIKTLSAFEHGRSTNMKHMFTYIDNCDTSEQRLFMIKELIDIVGENND